MSYSRDIRGATWENGDTKTAPETLATSRGPEPRSTFGGIVTQPNATQVDPATEYLDGCPECMARNNAAHTVEQVDASSVNAHFTCARCGFEWTCGYWTGVGA